MTNPHDTSFLSPLVRDHGDVTRADAGKFRDLLRTERRPEPFEEGRPVDPSRVAGDLLVSKGTKLPLDGAGFFPQARQASS